MSKKKSPQTDFIEIPSPIKIILPNTPQNNDEIQQLRAEVKQLRQTVRDLQELIRENHREFQTFMQQMKAQNENTQKTNSSQDSGIFTNKNPNLLPSNLFTDPTQFQNINNQSLMLNMNQSLPMIAFNPNSQTNLQQSIPGNPLLQSTFLFPNQNPNLQTSNPFSNSNPNLQPSNLFSNSNPNLQTSNLFSNSNSNLQTSNLFSNSNPNLQPSNLFSNKNLNRQTSNPFLQSNQNPSRQPSNQRYSVPNRNQHLDVDSDSDTNPFQNLPIN